MRTLFPPRAFIFLVSTSRPSPRRARLQVQSPRGLAFGWLPCLLWIALGVVLIGAVHDFTSLAASVRHGACSIAEVAKERISSPAGRAMIAFIWIALVYVIIAFADITAGSFVSAVDEIKGVKVNFNPGGAVASASVFYLLLSIVMGLTQKLFKLPLWLLTAILFRPLLLWCGWAPGSPSCFRSTPKPGCSLFVGIASLLPSARCGCFCSRVDILGDLFFTQRWPSD